MSDKHILRARVAERDERRLATAWRGECSCGTWEQHAATFREIEVRWAAHSGVKPWEDAS